MTLKNLAIFAAIAAVLYFLYKKRKAAAAPISTPSTDFGFGSDTAIYIDDPAKVVMGSSTTFTPSPMPTGGNLSIVLDQSGKTGMV